VATVQWVTPDPDRAAQIGLQAGAEVLLDESNRVAPIETGDLIRSGVAVADGNEAAVGYSSVYACRQHEELGYHHDEGRKAKYLEESLVEHKDRILDAIAAGLRGALGG
jgi:hypothetical protein